MGQLLKNCCGCSAFLPIPRLLFGEGRCSSAQDVWLSTQTQGIYAAETGLLLPRVTAWGIWGHGVPLPPGMLSW